MRICASSHVRTRERANLFLFVDRPFSVVLEKELVEKDDASVALNANKSHAHCDDVVAKDTAAGQR